MQQSCGAPMQRTLRLEAQPTCRRSPATVGVCWVTAVMVAGTSSPRGVCAAGSGRRRGMGQRGMLVSHNAVAGDGRAGQGNQAGCSQIEHTNYHTPCPWWCRRTLGLHPLRQTTAGRAA